MSTMNIHEILLYLGIHWDCWQLDHGHQIPVYRIPQSILGNPEYTLYNQVHCALIVYWPLTYYIRIK